ncbi:peptidoglycan DD-metalloendopeptidase family protein [Anabaena sp. UHCC 0253]|nr:peptidoglycan DD-metalloendopeptidase family protein [Anabaena sp. UHCC 0253]MTJ52463.1 peptidoglycan DD-metalloendopeptidase family protein [Anabaena sp. UHCC 0253]
MKRALKKREKAVLNNTPSSDDAPVEQTTYDMNTKVTRRARTHQAAMIGLAISMGATSLLVTRQSDQAQAAAPVGSQKAASTNPAVSETEIKFADTKLESKIVSPAGVFANPVILEPTVVSQIPGLEAKWQIATNSVPVEGTVSNAISPAKTSDTNSVHSQPQSVEGVSNNSVQSTLTTDNQQPETDQSVAGITGSTITPQNFSAGELASNDVDATLKAQQEFALNRLQEKSTRLRNSLTELRSEQTQDLLKTGIQEAQPTTVARTTTPEHSDNVTDATQTELISRLKQNKETSATVQKIPMPASASTKVVAQIPTSTYEVKPGDTLAEIANNYGTSVSDLVRANNLSDPNQLQINQKLIIPVAKMQDNLSRVDNFPLNTPSFNTNSFAANRTNVIVPTPLPERPQTPAITSGLTIPVPVVTEPQERINLPAVTKRTNAPLPRVTDNSAESSIPIVIPPALPLKSESYGLGGDTPLPRTSSPKQRSQKPVQKVSKVKGNERIRSLQAEIERLRSKYRAQQAGLAVPTDTENNNQSLPVAIETSSDLVVSQANTLQIPAPQAILPNYSNNQPVRPLMTASAPRNEPINPEFLSNKTGVGLNSSRNSSGIKLTVPPARNNASDTLGKMRGTTVSPALPPIAAVDIYLPQTTENNTNFPSNSSTGYIWPAKGTLTSGYGWRWGRMHRGIDIANSTGTPIYAASDGVVEKAGWNKGGYGNLVDIRHDDGSLTRYAHNSRILVQAGQRVQQGQTIAAMGSTGFSTGPHTHFEVHASGKGAVNPIAFLPNRL